MLKVDQALINTYVNASVVLPAAYENSVYSPTLGTAYAELTVLSNDVTAYSVNNSDETDGVFRIILRYPVKTGAVAAKTMADTILSNYSIGSVLEYENQGVTIMGVSRGNGYHEEGWFKIVLSIRYKAFIRR